MNKKLKVTTVKFRTVAGTEVELSLDEARDLYKELDELFGPKHVPTSPYVDYPWRGPYEQSEFPKYPAIPPMAPVVWCETRCDSGVCVSFGGLLQDYP